MKRKKLTDNDLINEWMVPYHGMTIEQAHEKEPWDNPHDFYALYPVTQEQHDEWEARALALMRQHYRTFRKRHWNWIYLNTSPKIKQ